MVNSEGRWEPPAHLSEEDVQFLSERRNTILDIQAKCNYDIARVLLQVKRKFGYDKGLTKWFYPWAAEALSACETFIRDLVKLAEFAETDPSFIKLVNEQKVTSLGRVVSLPPSVRDLIIERMHNGEHLSRKDIKTISSIPEVELLAAEDYVDEVSNILSGWKLKKLKASDPKERHRANSQVHAGQARLNKAIAKLQTLREENQQLDSQLTARDAVLKQLQRQLKETHVQHEQEVGNPKAYKARSQAKALCEAERSLINASSALEKISSDFDNLSDEARISLVQHIKQLDAQLTKFGSLT